VGSSRHATQQLILSTAAVLFAVAAGSLAGEQTLRRTDGSRAAAATLTAADLTYLGSYKIPTPSIGLTNYGYGLALRREPSDASNPVHLLTSAYYPSAVWTGTQRVKLEMRGSAIKVYVDTGGGYPGSPAISVTDSSITAPGKAGVFAGIAPGYSVDNVTATNAGGTAFVRDTMTDSDGTVLSSHAGGTAATWTRHAAFTSSTLEVRTNTIHLASGNRENAVYYASAAPINADYDVEADITYLTGASAAGVVGRVNSAAETMYLVYYFDGPQAWVLAKFVAGKQTNLGISPTPWGAVGMMGNTFEWRDTTPEMPAAPRNSASYSTATLVKEWGNIYGAAPSRRQTIYNGERYDLSDGRAGTNRSGGLFADPLNPTQLYWTFAETYSNDVGAEYIGYSELDYSSGTVRAHGSWSTSGTQRKGGFAGILDIPPEFVSAAGLGTKRLAAIGSRSASTVASGDASIGPQLIAFTPPVGAQEQTELPATRLVGYAPTVPAPGAGHGRPIRPGSMVFVPTPHLSSRLDEWPPTYWTLNDVTEGGCWLHGTRKSGFLSINRLLAGQGNYVAAGVYPEMYKVALSIISEADMLAVVKGAVPAYQVQPVTTEFMWDVLNPADYQSSVIAAIARVTSSSADTEYEGATVETATPHGLTGPGILSVQGTSRSAEYDNNWAYTVIDPMHIRISDPNHNSFHWSGNTAIGGTLRSVGNGSYPGTGIKVLGMACDSTTKKAYVGFVHRDDTPMVAVFAVSVD
jgi:hypothetical protein